jgi:hypothetical protein
MIFTFSIVGCGYIQRFKETKRECVYVCECKRERETETERERNIRERERETETEKERDGERSEDRAFE